jgi:L,D-peptidoglycan transpeptidase YkuD (ErfK/YbiS/YcfS/YnhG family)
MDLIVTPDGIARWGARAFRCALGRGGVVHDKREGDGGTPAGTLSLLRVLYRPDRIVAPECEMPVVPLRPDDGWCDAPEDDNYNRQVRLPYDASCEALWRADRVYDLIAVTSYNDSPAVPFLGSAIFVHVAKPDYAPTEGCIAFALGDLRSILRQWREADRVRIQEA